MSSKPLCIDLFCGLGGWTSGFLAEGWDVIGFDIEQHVYGEHRYPAQLVLQDVLTLHGRQLREASCIVASSPCQAYSYMAMPWSRAKQIARALRGQDEFPEKYEGYRTIEALNSLFEAPKRIQREACEAAGRFIPMIQENVRGAIPWVGRSQWNFGSYHLWGDIPAVMPTPHHERKSKTGSWDPTRANYTEDHSWTDGTKTVGHANMRDGHSHTRHLTNQRESDALKNTGGSWFGVSPTGVKQAPSNPARGANIGEGTKGVGIGSASWQDKVNRHPNDPRNFYSSSTARKAASAKIAMIPQPLARHIAQVYYPFSAGRSAQQ